MNDQTKAAETVADVRELAAWETPELRRLEASEAEGAGGVGVDNVVFS